MKDCRDFCGGFLYISDYRLSQGKYNRRRRYNLSTDKYNFVKQNITPVFYLSRLDFHFISSSHSPHRGKQVKKKLFTLKKTAFLSFFDRFAVFVCFFVFFQPLNLFIQQLFFRAAKFVYSITFCSIYRLIAHLLCK